MYKDSHRPAHLLTAAQKLEENFFLGERRGRLALYRDVGCCPEFPPPGRVTIVAKYAIKTGCVRRTLDEVARYRTRQWKRLKLAYGEGRRFPDAQGVPLCDVEGVRALGMKRNYDNLVNCSRINELSQLRITRGDFGRRPVSR